MGNAPELKAGSRPDAFQALEELACLADLSHAGPLAEEARRWAERVREGRFFVACLGQFKRGKSTLINALLGEPLLPVGVAPVTSVVTVVRQGPRGARVRQGDGWRPLQVESLADFVSESKNPENRLGVTGVEVFAPSTLLSQGLCLVDTPGLGSVFEGNTRETRSFVPHVDAALIVLGGDPPISGDELELLIEVAGRVREVIVVLNKADRLSAHEREEARSFTRDLLGSRLPNREHCLYEVSALERLEQRGPERDWPLLVGRLKELAAKAGAALVEEAGQRGLVRLSERLRHHLKEERQALVRPAEASLQRIEQLRLAAQEAELAAHELSPRFTAEQQRIRGQFQDDRRVFLEGAVPRLEAELHAWIEQDWGGKLRQRAMAQASSLAEAAVRAWRAELQPVAEKRFAAMTTRFTAEANEFLEQLRSSGRLPADSQLAPLEPQTELRARSAFCFLDLVREEEVSALTRLRDTWRSDADLKVSAERYSSAFLRRLLEVNANRVVGDLDDRILESRRAVEGGLRRRLESLVTTAIGALERADELRRQGESSVKEKLQQLNRWDLELSRLMSPERENVS